MTPMTRPLTPTQMIVETTCNHLYDVRPADGLDHVWIGTEVKRAKGGGYVPKARARPRPQGGVKGDRRLELE
jgi:hypothetical protein